MALLQFYVVPRLQRRGIGTEILKGLIAEARSQQKLGSVPITGIEFNG
jgi:GNAT superfamily N-acetyltransferase